MDDFPEAAPGRPVWLITLADLALLLVGFFVFIQSAQHLNGSAVAKGFRSAFRAPPTATPTGVPDPMPVASAGMLDFAPGSAALPQSPEALAAWARVMMRDPRVALRITGETDNHANDVDPDTGSGAVLAADRARAVAVALAEAHVVPRDRMIVTTAPGAGRRAVTVSLGFVGAANPNSGTLK
jgi:flagellar motor protein MotB